MVHFKAWNLHLAKLPEYQGYCTFNHAILNQESSYGVTLHWMEEKVDYGDIAYYEEFPITNSDTAYSLYQKSLVSGEHCFRKLMENMQGKGDIPRKKMEGVPKFYARKSIESNREIRDLSDRNLVDKVARACYFPPFESAYFIVNDKKVYVIPASNKEN